MTTPSVGRVVHYTAPNGEPTAAIVSKVHSDNCLTLTTFPITGPNVVTSVMYDEEARINTWHWPERV